MINKKERVLRRAVKSLLIPILLYYAVCRQSKINDASCTGCNKFQKR